MAVRRYPPPVFRRTAVGTCALKGFNECPEAGQSVLNHGSLAVGASGFGTLAVGGGGQVLVGEDLSINSVSTLAVTLSNPSDPFLDVNGSASLNGMLSVALSPSLTLQVGDAFTVIDIDDNQSGQFIGLSEGDFVTARGGYNLYLTYAGGDGNDVELNALLLLGDMNADGALNLGDVGPLVQALVNRTIYDAQYPSIDADLRGDADGSGTFDLGDIADFSAMFGGSGSAQAIPEPTTLSLAFVLLMGIAIRRQRRG